MYSLPQSSGQRENTFSGVPAHCPIRKENSLKRLLPNSPSKELQDVEKRKLAQTITRLTAALTDTATFSIRFLCSE